MKYLNILLLAVPVSIGLELSNAEPVWIFLAACLAILPLSGLMGKATEEISLYAGPQVGGLLNATFGNAAELIITIFALKAGLFTVVKASLTGSIIGNILLVLGLSIFLGGLKYKFQKFNQILAGTHASMLVMAVIGLLIPATFMYTARDTNPIAATNLSIGVAVVLILIYVASLLFSLHTHRSVFHVPDQNVEKPEWSLSKAIGVLLVTTLVVVLESELLVGSIEHTVQTLGWSEFFVGVIIIPIIGNAAEHAAAIIMALKNRVDISMEIAIGSSTQIALFVAPLLVFISLILGQPMDFIFDGFEITAIAMAILIAVLVSLDGESNWLEGAQLLAAYVIIALAFFFMPVS